MDLKFQAWGGTTRFNPHLFMIYGALVGPIAVLHGILQMSTIQMCAVLYAGAHVQAFLPAGVLHDGGLGFQSPL